MKSSLLIYIICIFALFSCVTTEYIEKEVPVETIKTEYVHNIKHDSIYIYDNTNTYTKGDTVYRDKIQIQYKSIICRDTIHIVDSIPYVIRTTEIKIKEVNKLLWYQKFLNITGIISLLSLFIYLYIKIKR